MSGFSPMKRNRWNIPADLVREVLERDLACVYCGGGFSIEPAARRQRASWEHIINDARIITRENIAVCCIGCNASKGAKALSVWLKSPYCESRGISEASVAPVVRAALVATACREPLPLDTPPQAH
jgi:hypothetical protein